MEDQRNDDDSASAAADGNDDLSPDDSSDHSATAGDEGGEGEADGQQDDSAEGSDAEGGEDAAEGAESADDTDGAGDDGDAGTEGGKKPKMVPYERFREVVGERNILKDLLQKGGVSLGGKKQQPAVKAVDLSKYTPRQIADAKALLGGILKEELGLVGNLNEQFQQMRERQEQTDLRQAEVEDTKQLDAALRTHAKETGVKYTKDLIEAQVLQWHKSTDPRTKAFAQLPYADILHKMDRMKAERAKKKPAAAPKVEKTGGDEGGGAPRKPSSSTRLRPDPANPQAWEDHIARTAFERTAHTSDE